MVRPRRSTPNRKPPPFSKDTLPGATQLRVLKATSVECAPERLLWNAGDDDSNGDQNRNHAQRQRGDRDGVLWLQYQQVSARTGWSSLRPLFITGSPG